MTRSDVHRLQGYLLTSADSGGPLPESLAPQDGIGPRITFLTAPSSIQGWVVLGSQFEKHPPGLGP